MTFLVVLGALLVRVGFAVHAAGMARSKNSAASVMRHFCDACVTILAFWAVGYAIVSSEAAFFGVDGRKLFGPAEGYGEDFPMLVSAMLVASGIVPSVLAERARFWPVLGVSVLMGLLLIPVTFLWVLPTGWVARMAGPIPPDAVGLHLPAAIVAAVGAIVVGARTGKFNRDGSSTAIPGHSVPLAGLGAFLLFVGFATFVGARSSLAATNVLLAAASGGVAAIFLGQFRYYKPDIHLMYAGVIGGVVAISAGANVVPTAGAVLIGAVAGVIVPMAILMLDLYGRIDDPSGNVAVHGVGAVWGLIASPLLARGWGAGERFKGLGANLLGVLAVAVLAVALSAGLWMLLKRSTKIRGSEADEFDGLDLAEHDIGAYPDFQQNTIKSYHLREV